MPEGGAIARATEGESPYGTFRATKRGRYLVALDRTPKAITLDGDKFNAYLAEEGLDEIRAWRHRTGHDAAPGRERYTRYLKALGQVGDAHEDDAYLRTLGQRLEIVLDTDPRGLVVPSILRAHVAFSGQPLSDATVFLAHVSSDAPGAKVDEVRARSDASGAVSFPIVAVAGRWMLHLVYMRHCVETCENLDFESFWASYTFALGS